MGKLLIICVVHIFLLINVYCSSSFQEHHYVLTFDDYCVFYSKCKGDMVVGGKRVDVDKQGEWANIVEEFISDENSEYSFNTKKKALGLSVNFREGVAFSRKHIVEQWLENVDLRHERSVRIIEPTVVTQETGDKQSIVNEVGCQTEGPVSNNFLLTYTKTATAILFGVFIVEWAALVKLYLNDKDKTISEFDVKEFRQWLVENKIKTLMVSSLTALELGCLVWLYKNKSVVL